jgi:hypothetical protein
VGPTPVMHTAQAFLPSLRRESPDSLENPRKRGVEPRRQRLGPRRPSGPPPRSAAPLDVFDSPRYRRLPHASVRVHRCVFTRLTVAVPRNHCFHV